MPAAVALVVIAQPLCSVLYQRGAFSATDTTATALVLAIYGAGLPAFVLHKVLQPLYYAREDSRSPFMFAIGSMITNAVMAVGMMPYIGFSAAAWATTLAGWVMVWQLWRGSRKMGDEAHFDARFRQRLPRIILSSAVMGAVLWLAAQQLDPYLHLHMWRYLALLLLCAIGIVTYFGTGAAIGAFKLSDFRALRRSSPAE